MRSQLIKRGLRVNNAISGSGVGNGLYLHKHDKCSISTL